MGESITSRPVLLLLIEPLQLVVLAKDGAVGVAAIDLVGGLLGVKAVKLGLGVLARVEHAEEDVAGAVVGHGGDADAAEQVVAVARVADADLVKVVDGEAGELVVREVADGLEVLGLVLIVVVAQMDEFFSDRVLELLEGLDGLGLGEVRGRPGVDGCFGGL